MFSHVVVGTNDLEKATRFYDAVLGALGGIAECAASRLGAAEPG